MAKLVAVAVALLLVVYALIDCLQTPRRDVRGSSKAAWVAAVLLLPVVGAVAWLVSGRSRPESDEPSPRPVAPDDDPDFLRQVATLDEEHEAFLRRWEREEERRRRAGEPPRAAGTPGGPPPARPAAGLPRGSEPARGPDPARGPEPARDAEGGAGEETDPKTPHGDEPHREPGS